MITINSNNAAKVAQNILNSNQLNLQGNMQRLSTGLRINSAADDAAGLQIANRIETQLGGLQVAQRNASDAISMAQTAEGGMQETTNVMNRIRDLAMQSYNDTNSEDDRAAIQMEVDSLQAEINRIAETTNFAGINLLDGTSRNLSFQIGATANDTIEFGIDAMRGRDLGSDIQEAVTGATIEDGVIMNDPFTLTVVDEDNELQEIVVPQGTDINAAVSQIDEELYDYGIEANAVFNDAVDPVRLEIVAHEEEMDFFEAGELSGHKNLSVDAIDVTTQAGATKAMLVVEEALAEVDVQRASLGAVQNRLEATISNLTNIEENLGVSQSRIMDADFAEETVNMTSNQMLMQAGVSVLAQASSMPQYASMLIP